MLRDPIWPDDLSARQELIQVLEQRRELRAPKPLPPVARSVGTCTAVDEETGKRCTLPAHGAGDHSASGRRFKRSLQPGEQPRRELDGFAIARQSLEASSGNSGNTVVKQEARARYEAKKKALKGEALFSPEVAAAQAARVARHRALNRENQRQVRAALRAAQDAAVEQLVAAPAPAEGAST